MTLESRNAARREAIRAEKERRRWLVRVVTSAAVAVALVVGGAAWWVQSRQPPSLVDVVREAYGDDRWAVDRVSDKSMSITLYDSSSDEAWSGTWTVLNRIECAGSVGERMRITRALDGIQTAMCGPFEVTWSYHPDNGFALIVGRS